MFCFVHMVWYGLELCFRVALLPSSACCDLRTLACPWRHPGKCVRLLVLQVALMSAVPSAVAALDGHRGMAVVAENGLGFLTNQSLAAENKVRLGVPGSVVGPRDSVRSTGGRVSDVLACSSAACVVGGGTRMAEAMWMGKWGEAWPESACWMCGGGGGGDGD